MAFFSGSSSVPPLGFEKPPTLAFEDGVLATASTCDLVLRIPTVHSNYENFKDALILSFKVMMDLDMSDFISLFMFHFYFFLFLL